jgi:hypothetical protein
MKNTGKTNKFDFSSVLEKVKENTGIVTDSQERSKNIVSVVDFINDKDLLGMPYMRPPMILTRVQMIILKCFYAGTHYNEDVCLNEEELEWLENWKEGKDADKQAIINNVLEKHNKREYISELILVLGRRSGKTMTASVIASYEAYKCLELGNPQEYYGLAPDNPIAILNIATAAPQAKLLFGEIKARIRYSKYFANKINQDASNEEFTYLLTDNDKVVNKELLEQGRKKELIKGSVLIQCGHSNSNSLMGSGIICLIYDELAYFNEGTGAKGGDKVYHDMVPATKSFFHSDGRKAGRVVAISAPSGKSGIFYNNFRTSYSPKGEGMMGFQFPTWECSPLINSKEQLATEFAKNPAEAEMRYGAEFSGALSTLFFPEEYIDVCIDHSLINAQKGLPYIKYYMHVDPALNNHNYAIVILHSEQRYNKELGERTRRIVIDHVKFWTPTQGKEICIEVVEKYIEQACRRFNIVSITYDAFNSASSIQKFRKKGLPVKRTAFRSSYKQLIFSELRNTVLNGELRIPPIKPLVDEFRFLKSKISANGFKVFPDGDSEQPTDDLVDCVAGAAHMTFDEIIQELPQATTFNSRAGANGGLGSLFNQNPSTNYGSMM